MKLNEKLFFIGSGNMAQAIISGFLKAELTEAENIICNDINGEKVLELQKKFGVSAAGDKRESLIEADVVFLSVKPQNMLDVLGEIGDFIKKEAVVISIAAGITTKFIEDNIKKEVAVVRVMPNTPALVLSSATALCKGRFVSDRQLQKAKYLFSVIGRAEILDERDFDIVTALSGSGTGYIFYFCELMQKAAEKLGLNGRIAREFAVQTVYGSGRMLEVTKESAEALKEKVKSPNGTTEAALEYFESRNLPDIVYRAMEQAVERSKKLSK
jgi:pyrroline-5-carboxylate reductase